jgi:hypothetical protein
MKTRFFFGYILLVVFLIGQHSPVIASSPQAALLTASVLPPSSIAPRANFITSVKVNNPTIYTRYCMKVGLTVSGGGFVRTSSQYQTASSIYSGATKSFNFSVTAPSTIGAVGTAKATVSWYETSSCSTTPITIYASAALKVTGSGAIEPAPWKFSVYVFPNRAVDDSVPVQFRITDSYGKVVGNTWVYPDRIPYTAAFSVPAKTATYTITTIVPYVFGDGYLPTSASKRVSITGTGQSVDLYP